jgi:hypothetical protein
MTHARNLPDLGERLRPLIECLPEPVRPRLLAILERRAGERYRLWAAECGDAERAAGLRACGAREDEIGDLVEGLFPPQPGEREQMAAVLPQIAEAARDLFVGRPLMDQFAIQAAGERRGAAVWRDLAAGEGDPARHDVLLRCARLEEESAELLESVVHPARA